MLYVGDWGEKEKEIIGRPCTPASVFGLVSGAWLGNEEASSVSLAALGTRLLSIYNGTYP